MKEKRYILDVTYEIKDSDDTLSFLSGHNVNEKDSFFKIEGVVNKEYEKDYVFDYLTPTEVDYDDGTYFLGDIHRWIIEEPSIYSFPVSEKLKNKLSEFNLFPNKFYDAKVLHNGEPLQYYVWQLFLNGFDSFIDLENSTFCEWNHLNKYGDESIIVKDKEEIDNYSFDNNWKHFGFNKAIMKPEFKNVDCCYLPYPYGIVISERLKNALEAANLTGFEIIECPVEFEYL